MPGDALTVTELLRRAREGDRTATDSLMPLVYGELRRLAGGYFRQKRGSTLQPTVLVHEAYLRLTGRPQPDWHDRTHFLCVAATIMRQVLVDHARAKFAEKRGGARRQVPLTDSIACSGDDPAEMLALDRAMQSLAAFDERKARVLELRYFGGLSVEETAQAMALSIATVRRDARLGEAWLRRELQANQS